MQASSSDIDYDELAKGVLKITCSSEGGTEGCTGSGVIVFESNIIVTNYHVIKDDGSFSTSLPIAISGNFGVSFDNAVQYVFPMTGYDDAFRYLEGKYGNNNKANLKFSIVSRDTVNVYCYKDGNTYTMVKQ